ncbi:MAG: hypothetical protein AABO57_21130 [Acidobacteriota bacterium]
MKSFDFDTVTVDAKGTITDRRKGQARYVAEDLGGGVTLDMVEILSGTFTTNVWCGRLRRSVKQSGVDCESR